MRRKVDEVEIPPFRLQQEIDQVGIVDIAARAGVTDDSGWAPVKGENFESRQVPGIHVLGDASFAGPMPKSAFAANNQGKMVAAALAAELALSPKKSP